MPVSSVPASVPAPAVESVEPVAPAEAPALAEAPAAGVPVGVPDGFSYQVTVDGRTVYCSDPRLTDEQRALISRVLKEGA